MMKAAPGASRSIRHDGGAAFTELPVAVHVMTEEGLIVDANASFDGMYGASARDAVGRHLASLSPLSLRANLRLLERLRRETAAGQSWRGTLVNRRADGRPFVAQALVCPMRQDGRRYLVCFQEAPPSRAVAASAEASAAGCARSPPGPG